jgi:tetratricopeptide (TPR) repeat protein
MPNKKIVFLIISFAILIYANSLGGDFVFDDKAFVVLNKNVHAPERIHVFFTDPAASAEGDLRGDVYRPVTALSYAAEYKLWKLVPFGYHLTNVLFHAANSALVFYLVRIISGDPRIAIAASLIFAAHPVQTEAVSWIAGRASVLFLFFYLFALILYLSFLNRKSMTCYAASIISFVLSLFSKEMAVTLPAVLIMHDIHFLKTRFRARVARYIPYIAAAFFFIIIRSMVLKKTGQMEGWGHPYHIFLTMTTVLVDYLRVLFFPLQLHAGNYVMTLATSVMEDRVFMSALIITIILAALPVLFRRARLISFSLWWFLLTLLPVMNIIPIKALQSERFLYLPSIGFCIAIAAAISIMDRKIYDLSKRRWHIMPVVIALIVSLFAARVILRNNDWRDEITMGKKISEGYPLSPWALMVLGNSYIYAGEYEKAIQPLKKAVALMGDDGPHSNLGMCYLRCDFFDEAIKEFQQALMKDAGSAVVRNMLGVAYKNLKKYENAEEQFTIILKAKPDDMDASLNLGRLYETQGDFPKAIKQYEAMLPLRKESEEKAIVCVRIGDAYEKMALANKAREYYIKARGAAGAVASNELLKILDDRMAR